MIVLNEFVEAMLMSRDMLYIVSRFSFCNANQTYFRSPVNNAPLTLSTIQTSKEGDTEVKIVIRLWLGGDIPEHEPYSWISVGWDCELRAHCKNMDVFESVFLVKAVRHG